ncbi:MAG TPA: VOC family protein, partial [Longimicrobium sp.]|nr:VOC family protein [Longimicrobium sp.]
WYVAPYFLVADVTAAANHYRDVLGFHYDRLWGDPPGFCMVKRAGIVVMLNQVDGARPNPNRRADPDPHAGEWDAYVWVDDADALHAEFASRGAKIVRGLCDQHYGCRDFEVDDLDGYRLCFGHDISAPREPLPAR